MKTPEPIQKLLQQRHENGRFRKLTESLVNAIDFYSNDYLGLARDKKLQDEFLKTLVDRESAYLFGSTGSRLVSGNQSAIVKAEEYLAEFFQAESAVLFPSGYQANLGFFSSVPQKNDMVVYDTEIHASIKSSLRQSHALLRSFRHNDLNNLVRKAVHSGGEIYVVVESIYSISGDMAPLRELADICRDNSFRLVVDEAHSTGLFGKEGRGLCCELAMEEDVFARILTFGKAVGVAGGIAVE